MIRFKVRQDKGEQILNLEEDTTFDALLSALGMRDATFKTAFPPRKIDFKRGDSIKEFIHHGDSIIAEEIASSEIEFVGPPMQSPSVIGTIVNDSGVQMDDAVLVVREVKDDNNCLFHCIAKIFLTDSMDNVDRLRNLVASEIQNNPMYSEAILEKPVDEYCRWIRKNSSWGGAIELGIFAERFQTSIVACDVKSDSLMKFGEFPTCCYLVYSGIHYDVIAKTPGIQTCLDFDIFVFQQEDTKAVEDACKILLHLWKQKHKYTDLKEFTLRCEICSKGIVGESGARDHSMKTGHVKYSEYS